MSDHKMLSDLYYHLVEEISNQPKKPTNADNRQKSHDTVEELEKLLNPDEKAVLHKLLEQWMDMEVASNEECFVLGFRTGAKLMKEILDVEGQVL